MSKYSFILVTLIIVTMQQKLQIDLPGTLYISDSQFSQKIQCRNGEGGQPINCQFKFRGLPDWLTFQNNELKMTSQPEKDAIRNIIIMGRDDLGRNTSRIIVLYIDYHYQQSKSVTNSNSKSTSTDKSTTTTTSIRGNIVMGKKQTAERNNSREKNIQVENNQKEINLTLVQREQPPILQDDLVKKQQLDEDQYYQLLSRQSRAHEKVAIYLSLLSKEKAQIEEIKYNITILETRRKQILTHEEILRTQIQEWTKVLKKEENELKNHQKGYEGTHKQLEKIEYSLKTQQQKLKAAKQKRSQLNKQIIKVTKEIERLSSQIKQVKERLTDNRKKCDESSQEIAAVNRQLSIYQKNKVRTQTLIKEINRQQTQYNKQIERLKKELLRVEEEKRKNSLQRKRQQANLQNINLKITQNQHKIKELELLCNQKVIDELHVVLKTLESSVESKKKLRQQLNSSLKNTSVSIQTIQIEISSFNEKLESIRLEMGSNSQKINEQQNLISEIQTRILRITEELTRSKSEKQSVERRILLQRSRIKDGEESVDVNNAKLQNLLIEKQLIDGLIKKFLLGEHHVIDNLGYRKLFQAYNDLPNRQGFDDINSIQEQLRQSTDLFEVNLIEGRNLKEEDREQCEGLKSAEYYGSGKITKIQGNNFEVSSGDGKKHILKVFSCSLNLSPIQDYLAQVGDLLCWRAFQFNGYDVVVESLVFRL